MMIVEPTIQENPFCAAAFEAASLLGADRGPIWASGHGAASERPDT